MRWLFLLGLACDTGTDSGVDSGALTGECAGLPWASLSGTSGPDTSWAVAVADDGDVLQAAHEGASLATDIVVRRFSGAGVLRWESRWDSGRADEAFVVIEGNGLVWVGGMTRSTESGLDGDTTAVLLRFDATTGDAVGEPFTWDSVDGWDELDGIGVGGNEVYLSGWSRGPTGDQDLRVLSLDATTLAVRWDELLGTEELDAGNGHLVMTADAVIVAGSWNSLGALSTSQGILVAFDRADGAVVWSELIGDGTDHREALGLGTDGERLFVVGWRSLAWYDWQLMVWAFGEDGGALWENEWGGAGIARSRSVAADLTDGSILVAGTSNDAGTDDHVVLRLDALDGTLLEEEVWGGTRNEGPNDVAVNGDRLYLAGPTTSWGEGETDALLTAACTRPWTWPAVE